MAHGTWIMPATPSVARSSLSSIDPGQLFRPDDEPVHNQMGVANYVARTRLHNA
jgi:hypothetical protein